QGLVVAALGFPFFDGLWADPLASDGHPRHVVGRIDREEQHEGQQVYADQNKDAIQQPSQNVGSHVRPRSAPSASAVARSRRLMMRRAGYRPTTPSASKSHNGHQTGGFQAWMRS